MANASSRTDAPESGARETTRTALERHAAFFDPDGNGVVTIGQTWDGLRRLGVHPGWRFVLAPIINGFLGYLTQGRPSLDIDVRRIAKGKHPFDTGVFDDEGKIDEAALKALVDAAGGGALTANEMNALIRGRGNRRAAMGRLAGALGRWFSAREVELLFCLAADATKQEGGHAVPALTARTLKRFYEGTLLHTIARRRRIAETMRARSA
jgi:peroxygenase